MTDTSKEAKRLWFTMVLMPDGQWRRTGSPHRSKSAAHDWVAFVKSYYRGLPVRVHSLALRRCKSGKLYPSVLRKLDKVYNFEVKDGADASTNNSLP